MTYVTKAGELSSIQTGANEQREWIGGGGAHLHGVCAFGPSGWERPQQELQTATICANDLAVTPAPHLHGFREAARTASEGAFLKGHLRRGGSRPRRSVTSISRLVATGSPRCLADTANLNPEASGSAHRASTDPTRRGSTSCQQLGSPWANGTFVCVHSQSLHNLLRVAGQMSLETIQTTAERDHHSARLTNQGEKLLFQISAPVCTSAFSYRK